MADEHPEVKKSDDEFPEVVLYSPGFSVTIKGSTTVDHAISEAERLFEKFRPKLPEPGPLGFVQTERRGALSAYPGSMPLVPRDL